MSSIESYTSLYLVRYVSIEDLYGLFLYVLCQLPQVSGRSTIINEQKKQ